MLQILGGRLGYWCFSRGGGIYEEIFETFCGIVINRKLKTPFSVQRSTWGRFSQWKWALATNILWCKFCDVKFPPPKNNNGLGLGRRAPKKSEFAKISCNVPCDLINFVSPNKFQAFRTIIWAIFDHSDEYMSCASLNSNLVNEKTIEKQWENMKNMTFQNF